MWIVPKHRFAFVLLANRNNAFFQATIQKAMEIMLPLEPAPPRTQTQALAMRDDEMASYVGTYSNENTVEIFLKDHRLFLREGKIELPLTKVKEHVFSAGWTGSPPQIIVLVPNASGRIEFLHRAGRALRRAPGSQPRISTTVRINPTATRSLGSAVKRPHFPDSTNTLEGGESP
jgi:hypothetical protein